MPTVPEQFETQSADSAFDDETDHDARSVGSEHKLHRTLARDETKVIKGLRYILILVMIIAAVLVSVFVYVFIKRDEDEAFQYHFDNLASRLVDGFHANAKLRLQVLHQLTTSIASLAAATNQEWPNVIIHDFEERALAAITTMGGAALAMAPIVTEANRAEWENFTAYYAYDWLMQSLAYQAEFEQAHPDYSLYRRGEGLPENGKDPYTRNLQEETYNGVQKLVFPDTGLSPHIYRFASQDEMAALGTTVVVENSDGPHAPLWQMAPVSPSEY